MARLEPRCALDRKMALKAPWNTRIRRDVPWSSTLLEELQYKRKERLFNLVDRHHVLQCEQFKSTDLLKDLEALVKKPSPSKKPGVYCCEMPLLRSTTRADCSNLFFYNCPNHMKLCSAPIWSGVLTATADAFCAGITWTVTV